MISDIRVNVLLRGHRKRRRLNKQLGLAPSGTDYLLDLWIATAVSRPDGVLAGWTPRDIADEVDWPGDPDVLLSALKDSGWIDIRQDGVVVLHDWAMHQGWATTTSARSNKARMKALLRHYGEDEAFRLARVKYGFEPTDYGFMLQHDSADAAAMLQHATADATAMLQQCSSNAVALHQHAAASAGAYAPSPNPSPQPSQKDSTKVLSGAKVGAGLPSKKPHYSKTAAEYASAINAGCLKVQGMCNGSKRFNPYQWAQHWINKAGHPQAVADSLNGVVQFWETITGPPWAYADKIMKTKSGNYHERDEASKSAGFKKMLSEVALLIGDLPSVGSRI